MIQKLNTTKYSILGNLNSSCKNLQLFRPIMIRVLKDLNEPETLFRNVTATFSEKCKCLSHMRPHQGSTYTVKPFIVNLLPSRNHALSILLYITAASAVNFSGIQAAGAGYLDKGAKSALI